MFRSNGKVVAIPPGYYISEVLMEFDVPKKALAGALSMDSKEICDLLRGESPVTPEIAKELETIMGVSAQFWLSLEGSYRKKLAIIEGNSN